MFIPRASVGVQRLHKIFWLMLAGVAPIIAQTGDRALQNARRPASFTITVATPSVPALIGTVPSSPSNDPAPNVVGTADPNVTITIFKSAFCTGLPVATGVANSFGNFSIPVSVDLNTTTTFSAKAGNSPNLTECSNHIDYVHDNIPPPQPTITGTTPPSPSTNANPLVVGAAATGSVVKIYLAGDCSGPPAATTTASAGAFSVNVTVPTNATTTITATATDAAGNVSACSAAMTYTNDTIPPAAPVLTGTTPVSPANHNHPIVSGTAEPYALVKLFTEAGCSGAVNASGFASAGGTFNIAATVADNSVTTFFAQATDTAGNISLCSSSGISYVENSNLPSGTVCGLKYADLNGNGIYEPGLGETGLGGWTILAISAHGDTTTAVTDGNGQYCFTTLTDTLYTVREEARQGTIQTGGQAVSTIDFYRAQNYPGIDFGNFVSGEIYGTKFDDSTHTGVRDTNEVGLPGWTICLTPTSLPPGIQYLPVTAKANLNVTGLGVASGIDLDGTLLVRRGVLDSVQNRVPTEMLSLELRSALPIVLGGENYRLLVRAGSGTPDAPPFSGTATHSYGWDPAVAGSASYGAYARAVLIHFAPGDSTGSVVGQFHHDEALVLSSASVNIPYPPGTTFAGDSVVLRDSLDQGKGSLRMTSLSLGAGNSPFCTETDTAGHYCFMGLPPGAYTLAEVQQACWAQTTPNPAPVTITSGDSVTGVDFGNKQLGSRVCLRALFDRNHNQLLGDPEDVPMPDVTFTLTGSVPEHSYISQTDGSGSVCFDSLPFDDYVLTEVPPSGYETILPKAGVKLISVTGCIQDTLAWLNTAAFTDSLFRTATVQEWATAMDHAGKRKSVKCKADKVDFKFTLAWRNGSVKLKFSMFTTGTVRNGTNKQLPPVATWDSVKTVTIDASSLGSPGDTLQFDGRGFKGKPVSIAYEWRNAALDLMGKGSLPANPDPLFAGVDLMKQNALRYPMPDLHNVGEELERQGAFPIFVGVPAESHSVVHFKYKDVLKSLVKDSRGVLTFHTDSTHCLDFFLNTKPIAKRVKSLPPDKANNGLFAEILALKLNIAASQKGKFPPGLDTLIYDYHWVDATPLDSFSVGEICKMADTLINCNQDPHGLSLSPLEYYRIIKRINAAFASPTVDTESWSCGKLVLSGVKALKDVPFLRANPGSLHDVAVPFLTGSEYRPIVYALEQNYPNPFNPTTSIQFTIEHTATVSLIVYNTLGQQVAALLDKELLDEGTHELEFDASNLPSGVYFYRLVAEGIQDDDGGVIPGRYVSMRKMVLMK